MTTSTPQPGNRLEALEAIRGIAALVVVLHHLAHAFWPGVLQAHSPWRSAFDGSLAVTIFFVLSGIVLSIAYFERPSQQTLAAGAIRRYFRLTLPILASVLLGYVLLRSGVFANLAAADAMNRGPDQWLRHFYTFAPNFGDALKEGTYRTYLGYDSTQSYNPVLWTMSVELFGSFFVLAFLALAGGLRRRWLLYFVIAAVLYVRWRYTLNFVIGLALCDFYVQSRRVPIPPTLGRVTGIALLVAGMFIGSALPGWFGDWVGLSLPSRRLDCQTLGAVLIVAAALFCPLWKRVLRFSWLGRVSFSLYLLHHLIIGSLGCRLFLLLRNGCGWSFEASSFVAAVAVVAVSLAAAWCMARSVDRWSIALGRSVSRLFLEPQPGNEAPQPARVAIGSLVRRFVLLEPAESVRLINVGRRSGRNSPAA